MKWWVKIGIWCVYHPVQFFPELPRVILLDDDVVVRKDLAGLWEQDLDGNIMGAVGAHRPGADGGICIERTLSEHLNFTDPAVSSLGLDGSHCTWSWGATIVDLDAWRGANVTETYQLWLQKASPPFPELSPFSYHDRASNS